MVRVAVRELCQTHLVFFGADHKPPAVCRERLPAYFYSDKVPCSDRASGARGLRGEQLNRRAGEAYERDHGVGGRAAMVPLLTRNDLVAARRLRACSAPARRAGRRVHLHRSAANR